MGGLPLSGRRPQCLTGWIPVLTHGELVLFTVAAQLSYLNEAWLLKLIRPPAKVIRGMKLLQSWEVTRCQNVCLRTLIIIRSLLYPLALTRRGNFLRHLRVPSHLPTGVVCMGVHQQLHVHMPMDNLGKITSANSQGKCIPWSTEHFFFAAIFQNVRPLFFLDYMEPLCRTFSSFKF